MDQKVGLEIDNWDAWCKFPHVEPIVIVTSIDKDGVADGALKSTFAIVNMNPMVVVFSCTTKHQTARNILETKEFVVNFPSEDIIKETMATTRDYRRGVDKIKESGLTTVPAKTVRPPLIKECNSHLECVLEWTKRYGSAVVIAGRVLHAWIDKRFLEVPDEDRCRLAKSIVIAAVGRYGVVKDSSPFPE